jgi:XapX domain-containing protein
MDTNKSTGTKRNLTNMKDIFLSILTGFGCGVVFAAFKLPVPAPPVFAGVAGIVGLWIGFSVITKFIS